MTREELGLNTPRSFQNKMNGYNDAERDRMIIQEKIARDQTTLLMYTQGKSFNQPPNMRKLWPIKEIDVEALKQEVADTEKVREDIKKYNKLFKGE